MRLAWLLLACGLAGCATGPVAVTDVATLPPNAFPAGTSPANAAAYAFGDAGRTYGRPDAAAQAVAALDYMAGATQADPALQEVSAASRDQLLVARQEVRATLQIRPGASSQAVVDALLGAARLLAGGDTAGAASLLDRSGVFAVPGQQVTALLADLPYNRDANLATQHAADELAHNDTEFRHF